MGKGMEQAELLLLICLPALLQNTQNTFESLFQFNFKK